MEPPKPITDNLDHITFSWKRFFSEVFILRKGNEIEERLSWGFPGRVPDLAAISTEMPRPWLFARCLCFGLIGFSVLWYALAKTENVNFIPALMMFGCFAIPCSIMVLFYETNIFRDVSFIRTIGGFLAGAVMSLCLAIPIFALAQKLGFPDAAWVAGPVEEPAKLIAAVFLLRFVRHKTIFCGLLVGSAVGAGFAAFESAGYALSAAFNGMLVGIQGQLQDLDQFGFTNRSGMTPVIDQVTEIILLRGALSPFMHVAWTALTTAALCHATGGRPLTSAACKDPRFYGIFILVVGLHMTWNSTLGVAFGWFKPAALGLVAWIALASMLKNGLRQARSMKLALAAGDRSVLGASAEIPRASRDQDLWYQSGSQVCGPLKLPQLKEMFETSVLGPSTLVSDGNQWKPLVWWLGKVDGSHEIKNQPAADIWAWAIAFWPAVFAVLFFIIKSDWTFVAFPMVLFGMAMIDRSANRGRRSRNHTRWPNLFSVLFPPIYLAGRKKFLMESHVKTTWGSTITVATLGIIGFLTWTTYFTDEGRAMELVNAELANRKIPIQCTNIRILRNVTSDVKIMDARFSDGTTAKVTFIRQKGKSRVEISPPQ